MFQNYSCLLDLSGLLNTTILLRCHLQYINHLFLKLLILHLGFVTIRLCLSIYSFLLFNCLFIHSFKLLNQLFTYSFMLFNFFFRAILFQSFQGSFFISIMLSFLCCFINISAMIFLIWFSNKRDVVYYCGQHILDNNCSGSHSLLVSCFD